MWVYIWLCTIIKFELCLFLHYLPMYCTCTSVHYNILWSTFVTLWSDWRPSQHISHTDSGTGPAWYRGSPQRLHHHCRWRSHWVWQHCSGPQRSPSCCAGKDTVSFDIHVPSLQIVHKCHAKPYMCVHIWASCMQSMCSRREVTECVILYSLFCSTHIRVHSCKYIYVRVHCTCKNAHVHICIVIAQLAISSKVLTRTTWLPEEYSCLRTG